MNEDQKHMDLLQLLSRYDFLLEQLQKSMSDGFNNLCRANYHNKDSLRGRYGMDYWDETYEGQLITEIDVGGKLNIVKRRTREEQGENDNVGTDKEGEEYERELRKRNCDSKKQKAKLARSDDPLRMFGGALSIPTSLRQCQTNFKGGIPLIEELTNCKRDIQRLAENYENI